MLVRWLKIHGQVIWCPLLPAAPAGIPPASLLLIINPLCSERYSIISAELGQLRHQYHHFPFYHLQPHCEKENNIRRVQRLTVLALDGWISMMHTNSFQLCSSSTHTPSYLHPRFSGFDTFQCFPLSEIYDDHNDHTPDDNFGSPNFWPV